MWRIQRQELEQQGSIDRTWQETRLRNPSLEDITRDSLDETQIIQKTNMRRSLLGTEHNQNGKHASELRCLTEHFQLQLWFECLEWCLRYLPSQSKVAILLLAGDRPLV